MTGGRFVVLYVFASSSNAITRAALQTVRSHRKRFDDAGASFFGVSADPADESEARLQAELPGIRYFFDQDGLIGRLYGTRSVDGEDRRGRDLWYVLDPLLRVRGVLLDGPDAAAQVIGLMARLPLVDQAMAEQPVPVLTLPDIFEPEFCSRLIQYYDQSGSRLSGVFTQNGDGPSEAVTDPSFKRRRDCPVRDRRLVEQIQARIIRRVVPEIRKVYQYEATQLDRLILASYDSRDSGCFGAHRDNTVAAAAHRRFAVSINLNDAFEGGELVFPEFSRRGYRSGAGGATIFSCSLMHLVTPVTAGRRLACLPFVYDDTAAKLKSANAEAARQAAASVT